jgi:hypothetical protein
MPTMPRRMQDHLGRSKAKPAMTSTTTNIVYRGVPCQKGGVHNASGVSRHGAALLTYRGVSYSTGSVGFRSKATLISHPLGGVIELQFLGNRYQRAF